jgi:hypothetical protein
MEVGRRLHALVALPPGIGLRCPLVRRFGGSRNRVWHWRREKCLGPDGNGTMAVVIPTELSRLIIVFTKRSGKSRKTNWFQRTRIKIQNKNISLICRKSSHNAHVRQSFVTERRPLNQLEVSERDSEWDYHESFRISSRYFHMNVGIKIYNKLRQVLLKLP